MSQTRHNKRERGTTTAPRFPFFPSRRQTLDKPEAIAALCEGLEKRGLYTPPALVTRADLPDLLTDPSRDLTTREYYDLQREITRAAVTGQIDRAQFMLGICNRHTPEELTHLRNV